MLNASVIGTGRDVLQGAQRGSCKPLLNFWLIIQALSYWHRKYQMIQVIHQHQNIDTHTSIYQYILPVHTFKCQNKNKKENIACWHKLLLNKVTAFKAFKLSIMKAESYLMCI
jgi:hypothetical protein